MSEAKVRIRVAHNAMHLPVVALRGLVVFPNNVVHFEVGRQKSIAAIEAAMHANSNIFLIAQKDMETEEPTAQDLYAYGVISEIKQVLRVSEDLVKVLVEGKSRAKLLDLDASGKYLQADVRPAPVRGVAPDKRTQTEALVRSLKECFEEYLSYSPQISKDVVAVWTLFSKIFSFYIGHFWKLSYIYGSLAAIVLITLWLNVNINVLFLGAGLNAKIQGTGQEKKEPDA